jgi:hypothetical protein
MSDQPNPTEDSQGHPAWEPYLADVPEEFHGYVTKAFKAWDEAVVPKSKVQELEEQYNPYKEFLDNQIEVEELREAYGVRQALEENPEQFIRKAVEIFGLDNLLNGSSETPPAGNAGGGGNEWEDGDDIASHPVVAALQKQLEEVTGRLSKQDQTAEETRQAEEFDQYLDGLKETYKEAGEFDEAIVSGLIAAGWDGDEAVKHYFSKFGAPNQAPTPSANTQPPVVMGGDGSTGSGIPQNPVSMGALDRNGIEDVIMQMIENAEKE